MHEKRLEWHWNAGNIAGIEVRNGAGPYIGFDVHVLVHPAQNHTLPSSLGIIPVSLLTQLVHMLNKWEIL